MRFGERIIIFIGAFDCNAAGAGLFGLNGKHIDLDENVTEIYQSGINVCWTYSGDVKFTILNGRAGGGCLIFEDNRIIGWYGGSFRIQQFLE